MGLRDSIGWHHHCREGPCLPSQHACRRLFWAEFAAPACPVERREHADGRSIGVHVGPYDADIYCPTRLLVRADKPCESCVRPGARHNGGMHEGPNVAEIGGPEHLDPWTDSLIAPFDHMWLSSDVCGF